MTATPRSLALDAMLRAITPSPDDDDPEQLD
jgi:hypothetical protein